MRKLVVVVLALSTVIVACGPKLDEAKIMKSFNEKESQFEKLMRAPKKDTAVLYPLYDTLLVMGQQVEENFPKSASLPDVYFVLGNRSMNVHGHSEASKNAVKYFDLLIKNYPEHESAERSMFLLGNVYAGLLHDEENAIKMYKATYKKYGNSLWGEAAKTELRVLLKIEEMENKMNQEHYDRDSDSNNSDSTETKDSTDTQ